MNRSRPSSSSAARQSRADQDSGDRADRCGGAAAQNLFLERTTGIRRHVETGVAATMRGQKTVGLEADATSWHHACGCEAEVAAARQRNGCAEKRLSPEPRPEAPCEEQFAWLLVLEQGSACRDVDRYQVGISRRWNGR